MIEFHPEITKEFILSKVSQEEIFEMYGVPVVPYMFRSPLRNDRDPTCKFYRKQNGKLILRDYTGHFWGDCFDLVTFKTGKKFYDALYDVALRFGIVSKGNLADFTRFPAQPKFNIEPQTNEIRVKRMSWTTQHMAFWERICVSRSTLNKFRVSPLERAWLNGESIFWYGVSKEIAFVYHFPEYGPYEYKLYFPFRETRRFVHSNADILQGYHLMPPQGEYAVVTKSYKDVIALSEFNIPACAPMSETQIVSLAEAEDLMNRFEHIFTLYDIDKLAGVKSMQKMKALYKWKPLFFNVRKNHPKDFTDFIAAHGRANTYLLIETVKSYI
jgi:hypothetical protein